MLLKVSKRLPEILHVALIFAAFASLFIYGYVAISRMAYPFELEWIEGAMVEQVRRILAGQPLYVRPSLDFIPYAYPPVYSYLAAFVSRIMGSGLLPLRLVSFAASLGCFSIIYRLVQHDTRNRTAALLASGLFAATFHLSGNWFDLARVDSLYLMLMLLAMYVVKCHPSSLSWIVAGICISLSILTKQTALIAGVCLGMYGLATDFRRALGFWGTLVLLVGGSTWLFDTMSDGWYSYYIFTLLPSHAIMKKMVLSFWTHDLLLPLGIACCLVIGSVLNTPIVSKKSIGFYPLMTAGIIGSGWLPRLKSGGYENNLMPAHAIIAILFGMAFHALWRYFQSIESDEKKRAAQVTLYLACLVQFAVVSYNPFSQIPTRQDREAGQAFVSRLAQFHGDILMPCHGYLATLAGLRSFAHEMAIHDNLTGGREDVRRALTQEIRQAIAARKFQAIILDHEWWFSEDVKTYYQQQGQVFEQHEVFFPVTGFRTRPEAIYLPNNENP